eukprot:Tamp_05596.p1 GENE.Tamp_05596~~Tamp_05596.p1  ORF type:complete len:201 (+),score=21.78 Tamp_05596:722-1324(+)
MRQAVTAGGALSQQVLQALAEAHVLVLVVKDDSGGRAPDEEKGAQDMHDAAAEDQGKQPGAYICDWLSGLAGVQPGRGPPAIFGLALDGSAVPVCEEGWGRLRLQWFHKKTPLQTSIAIDQDMDDAHNLTPLVDAIGLLMWPGGQRARAPAPKCHIRSRRVDAAPTPDTPLNLPPHLKGVPETLYSSIFGETERCREGME